MADYEFQIGCLLRNEQNNNADHCYLLSNYYFIHAFTYSFAAEKLATASQTAIHNAYYGLGIEESNSRGWLTFEDWLNNIEQKFDKLWADKLRNSAIEQANQIINGIVPTSNQVASTSPSKH